MVVLQFLLCVFNVFVTWRSFAGWLRKRRAASGAGAQHGPPLGLSHLLAAAESRHRKAGLATPTAHVAIAGASPPWPAPEDSVTASKQAAQQAYNERLSQAARQRRQRVDAERSAFADHQQQELFRPQPGAAVRVH